MDFGTSDPKEAVSQSFKLFNVTLLVEYRKFIFYEGFYVANALAQRRGEDFEFLGGVSVDQPT